MADIKWTDQYDLFELHPQNRLISDGDGGWKLRKDLIASMSDQGFLQSKHLTVERIGRQRFRIIEGHNRFVTAKALGIRLAYIAYSPEDLAGEKPGEAELTQKPWTTTDYVRRFVHAGIADYAKLDEFVSSTGIPTLASASLLYGNVAGSGNVNAMLKRGDFRITDEEYAWLVASVIAEIKNHAGWATSNNCVNAVSRCLFAENFDVKKFKEKLRKNPMLMEQQRSVDDYVHLFEDIYNRSYRGRKYRLFAEVEEAMAIRKRSLNKNRAKAADTKRIAKLSAARRKNP